MKVTLMLADAAQVSEGKLYILGGGWTVTGPEPIPFAIAMHIEVPWDQANTRHSFRLELIDADGQPIMIETPEGEQPIVGEGEFEVGRPPGVKAGTPLTVPMVFNLSPAPPIPAGGRYEWRLLIDGQTDEDWRLTFSTRPARA
jgi:hypothetical protein